MELWPERRLLSCFVSPQPPSLDSTCLYFHTYLLSQSSELVNSSSDVIFFFISRC